MIFAQSRVCNTHACVENNFLQDIVHKNVFVVILIFLIPVIVDIWYSSLICHYWVHYWVSLDVISCVIYISKSWKSVLNRHAQNDYKSEFKFPAYCKIPIWSSTQKGKYKQKRHSLFLNNIPQTSYMTKC